jgi:hypothetical protein
MILATERTQNVTQTEKYIFKELVREGQSCAQNDFHRAVAAIADQDHSVARTHMHLTALASFAAYGLSGPTSWVSGLRKTCNSV